MLDRNNITHADDSRGAHKDRTAFKVRHAVAGAAALGVFGWMVTHGDACSRPLLYVLGWMVAIPAAMFAMGPLLNRLPDHPFDDDVEVEP